MGIAWAWLLGVAGGLLGGCGAAPGRGSLRPLPDPGVCAPPPDASAPAGLRGYRRFFANASLIGRPVPCTRDDKVCFRHNLLFDWARDRCEPVAGSWPDDCDLRPNRTEFERGSRMVGVCQTHSDPCPGYRMAYDGRCYRKEVVRDTICGCGAKPSRHFMGGVECGLSPAAPIDVQQPEEEGRCRIPDLRFPDFSRDRLRVNMFSANLPRNRTRNDIARNEFECSSAEALCFAKKKLLVKGTTACYPLLKQGPCPKEHVVALDIHSANEGRAEGTCVHVRGGCPPGYKRMLPDGQCHEDREIAIEAPGYIDRNVYGENFVLPYGVRLIVSLTFRNCTCGLKVFAEVDDEKTGIPNPPCEDNNQDLCALYDVETEPPIPEL